jgi:D-galactarolactone cycloisomerase
VATAVDDLAGLAELRRRTGLTMVNGETHVTRFDLWEYLIQGATEVYMPNIARSGDSLREAIDRYTVGRL